MKKISKVLFLLVTATVTILSCSKDEIKDKITSDTDTTTIAAASTIDAANALDIQTGIEINAEKNNLKTSSIASTCAVITIVNANYPKVITVDYGTGCTIGKITRKGKLKITFSAPIHEKGSKMTIERIDYSINGRKLEGSIDYTNTTSDTQTPEWLRSVNDGKFTDIDGKVFLNSGSCIIKQTGGVSTPLDLTDNIYEMTQGQHTVTNEAGNRSTLSVEETLVKKYSCEFISKGKLKIDGGLLNGVIDYGNGDCDNSYTFTHKNGSVFDLKMQ